ncbi:MAG: nitroreductase family deazaflavin-dependent oxidoreductase [Thermoleophilia bacterium]|nr:nitroreductase family deazaflavin-dependent oxidoreductase [Thermoleophilia bacterium]
MALTDETPIDPTGDGWVAEHVRTYVQSGGTEGHHWQPGVPTLLLTTRGKRSGSARRTALIYGEHGGEYIVMASYAGSPTHPDWYLNLDADGEVVVQVGTEVMPASARTATDAEREQLWRVMTDIWPDYDEYATKTTRTVPLVAIRLHA